jgi:hypothetical protein
VPFGGRGRLVDKCYPAGAAAHNSSIAGFELALVPAAEQEPAEPGHDGADESETAADPEPAGKLGQGGRQTEVAEERAPVEHHGAREGHPSFALPLRSPEGERACVRGAFSETTMPWRFMAAIALAIRASVMSGLSRLMRRLAGPTSLPTVPH